MASRVCRGCPVEQDTECETIAEHSRGSSRRMVDKPFARVGPRADMRRCAPPGCTGGRRRALRSFVLNVANLCCASAGERGESACAAALGAVEGG